MTDSIFVARVTDIEKYEYMMASEGKEWEKSSAQLLQELREGAPEKPVMRAGTLGHKIIENAAEGDIFENAEEGDIIMRFLLEEDGEAADAEIDLLPIREHWVKKFYRIGNRLVLLSGKIDGAKPGRVVDYKFQTKFDTFALAEAFQWRAYLDMMGSKYWEFCYSHFTMYEVKDEEKMEDHLPMDKHIFDVLEHNELVLHDYPEIHGDVCARLRAFLGWSDLAGWEGRKLPPAKYLPPRPV